MSTCSCIHDGDPRMSYVSVIVDNTLRLYSSKHFGLDEKLHGHNFTEAVTLWSAYSDQEWTEVRSVGPERTLLRILGLLELLQE